MDEKVYSYLSDRDNFMNFFDGIKSDIVNKAKADQIFVDEYEPSDEIIDKYIDLQASFDKLYNSLIY